MLLEKDYIQYFDRLKFYLLDFPELDLKYKIIIVSEYNYNQLIADI